ncbi:unnamed protein product [Microthlaspi erraticum]|uniref:Arabidopsis retrotransposon Orf1 C-terminal domain-containing protein n=1 Tax=Microthlaspi erraticum TaxID=1685480 RepID=A0A6D2JER6_9BRAS|nr:unnamed protein product [Microthlaspi erraticum]
MVGLAQPMPKKVSREPARPTARSSPRTRATRPRNPTSRSNHFKMLRGEGSKPAFTKREITRGARNLKTLPRRMRKRLRGGRRRGESKIEESEHESNENVPMEEEESEEEEDELPMYQEHYDALFSMDFVETKYPHDDTMRLLGSLRCGAGPQEHALGQVLLLPLGVIQGAHL